MMVCTVIHNETHISLIDYETKIYNMLNKTNKLSEKCFYANNLVFVSFGAAILAIMRFFLFFEGVSHKFHFSLIVFIYFFDR